VVIKNNQDFFNQTVPRGRAYGLGLSFDMINDKERNLLYDNLIKNNVYNKTCTDIGFGSGILTLMCLHHGASHVYAYEPDKTTFDFGYEIISQFGLSHKVTFINDYYDGKIKTDVTVFEQFSNNIWGEGLLSILNKIPDNTFIIPHKLTAKLVATKFSSYKFNQSLSKLDTGIPYLSNFNKIWNKIIKSDNFFTISDSTFKITDFEKILKTFDYCLKKPLDTIISTDFVLEKPCFITCLFYIDSMMIYNGHWNIDKVIYIKNPGVYSFNQRLTDGQWWISKKELF